jgi:hypothetical protein
LLKKWDFWGLKILWKEVKIREVKRSRRFY